MRIAQSIILGSIAVLASFASPVSAAPSSLKSHAGANAQTTESEPASSGCHAYQKAADGTWVEIACHEGSGSAPAPEQAKSRHHHTSDETAAH